MADLTPKDHALNTASQDTANRISIPGSNSAIISTSVDIFAGTTSSMTQIGYAQSISLTDARPTQPIRHLNSYDAGRIVEQAPQPETITLSLVGFEIYNDFLINKLGSAGETSFHSLADQRTPLTIVEMSTHPAFLKGVASTEGAAPKWQIMVYTGCWMTNWTRATNIGTVTVSSTVAITASRMHLGSGDGGNDTGFTPVTA